jgi:hypothetical protein
MGVMIRRLFTLRRKPPTSSPSQHDDDEPVGWTPMPPPDDPIWAPSIALPIAARRTVIFDVDKVVEISATRTEWVLDASRAIADGVDMYPIVRRVARTYDKRHEARIKQRLGRDCGWAKCLVCQARGVVERMEMTDSGSSSKAVIFRDLPLDSPPDPST